MKTLLLLVLLITLCHADPQYTTQTEFEEYRIKSNKLHALHEKHILLLTARIHEIEEYLLKNYSIHLSSNGNMGTSKK